jgi:drug/metabolite transporter (DMT)-like permease
MNGLAFGLVLVSAFMHATWNLLAKRAGGGMAMVWLFSTVAAVIYLPIAVAVFIIQKPVIGTPQIIFIAGSVIIHIAYYFLLQRGYSSGDLSLVYPLARGTGPMLSIVGAVFLLGERPSAWVIVGALCVTAGVLILTGNPLAIRGHAAATAISYGLLCGLSIAAYTLWDKQAVSVSTYAIPPLIFTWAGNASQAILLAPTAYRNRDRVANARKNHRREVFGIGILDSLSYILFLIALSVGTVSNLAPVRQTSILIGAFLGARLLSEDASRKRIIAAGVMLLGLIALAFG